ncbi:hypothetical protein H0X10_01075 [Candidatus Saccharibacteria bacterium]|nr:hypothetical protein [Candidatus Saccharibacteria bacterium]
MAVTLIESSPDDFWSKEEEIVWEAEFDRRSTLAQIIGRGPVHEAVFSIDHEPDLPISLKADPYNHFPYLNLS